MLTFMAVQLLEFRFAVADQHWQSTEFGHHWFHVARVHDHSPLPVPWWCLQCQMRWSMPRPVSNSKKQSAATGILNGLALGYLSTIIPVVGLDITFLIAQLCVASSAWHWEPRVCLAHRRRADRSQRISTSHFPRRSLSLARMQVEAVVSDTMSRVNTSFIEW